MIQWMHKLSQSWVASLLMGALSLSFVVWGIADIFSGQSASAVATVGSADIPQDAFQRSYRNFVRNEGRQMGREITPDMAQKMGLGTVALQQVVSRTALDNYATKLGIVTSDSDVAQYVRSMEVFRGPTGQFDHGTFVREVQAAGYSEDQFIAEARGDLTRAQVTQAAETNFVVPSGYGMAFFLFLNERRAADYVIVSPDSVGPVAAPDDKTLAAYVKDNPGRFSTPEYRDVDYAYVAPSGVLSQITVSDAQIAQEYNARKATYIVPEKRDIAQIEFKTEADAKAARARLDTGTTFEALAASRGLKPADITLGTLTQADIPDPDRAKAAFGLAVNEPSQPVKGAFGWVILKVSKVTPGVSRSLDEVKSEIRGSLTAQMAANKLVDIVNAFTDARSRGVTLAQAAQKVGMSVGHVKAMDPAGLAPDGSKTDVPADPEFLAGVFAADVGQDGDPFSAKSGAYYVVKVNGVTPPKLKSLELVRADAAAQWENQKRQTLLVQKARDLLARAQKEKSLGGVATALHVNVQKSPAITRATNDTMFSTAFVQQLYSAPGGGIVSGPQGLSGNFIIAQVTGITHPKSSPQAANFRQAVQQLSASVAGDFSIAMSNAERARQGVKVNQKLVDSTVGGGG